MRLFNQSVRGVLLCLVLLLGPARVTAATGPGGGGSVTGVTVLPPLTLSGTQVRLPASIALLNTNLAFTNAAMIFSNVLTLNPTSTTPRLNGMHLTNQAALARVGDTIRVSPGTYWSPTNVFSVLRNGVNWDVAEGATLIFGTTGDESDYNIPFNDWSGAVTSYISGSGTFIVSNNLANLLNLTNSASRVIWHAKEIRAANEQAAIMQGHPSDTVGGGSKLWVYASDGIYADGYDAIINQHNPNSAQTFIYTSRLIGDTTAGDSAFETTVAYANPGDCIIRAGYARGDFTLSDNMDVELGTLNLGANNVLYSPLAQQGNGVLRNTYVYGTSNRTTSLISTPSDSGLFATHGTFIQCVFVGSTNRPLALITNDNGIATTFIASRFWDGFGATNSIRSKNAQKVVLIGTDTPLGLHANVTASTSTNHTDQLFKKLATFEQGIDVSSDLNANGQLNATVVTATGETVLSGGLELANAVTTSRVLMLDANGKVTNVTGTAGEYVKVDGTPGTPASGTNNALLNAGRFVVTNSIDRLEVTYGNSTNIVIDWGATNAITVSPSNTFTVSTNGTLTAGMAREVDLLIINTNSTAGYFFTTDLNGAPVVLLSAPSTNRFKVNFRGGRTWISSGQQTEIGTNAVMRTRTGVLRTWVIDGSFFVTNGLDQAATPTTYKSASNNKTFNALYFDTGLTNANFNLTLPPEWDRNDITLVPIWTATNGSSGNAVWQFATDYSDNDDTLDGAFGSNANSTDAWLGNPDYHIGPSATPSFGNPASTILGNVSVRVRRSRDHASDTLDAGAFLLRVLLQYRESTTEPSALP